MCPGANSGSVPDGERDKASCLIILMIVSHDMGLREDPNCRKMASTRAPTGMRLDRFPDELCAHNLATDGVPDVTESPLADVGWQFWIDSVGYKSIDIKR